MFTNTTPIGDGSVWVEPKQNRPRWVEETPESVGISSKSILKYLKILDSHGLSTHSVLIARGDRLICRAYWKPFDEGTPHRMYSQTKSYVGVAVRLLAHEGKISLDDKITSYFLDKLPEKLHPYLAMLTIRDMLMMRTCFDDHDVYWFGANSDDRVRQYFSQRPAVLPGTQYKYDSSGSFVLGALIERVTGKTFLEYLREKCLDEIGFSKDAYVLQCPGGCAWADSALLCTPLDMLRFGRLVGRRGMFGEKQLLPREIFDGMLEDETGNLTCGARSFDNRGYISQLWRFYGNSVGFNGMHDQFTLYDPDTDITFTCTAGNYRESASRELMVSYLFSEIIEPASTEALPENGAAYKELSEYIAGLQLTAACGKKVSPLEKELNGKTFTAEENPMGIRRFTFFFEENECRFVYTNAQGEKELRFGREKNILQPFPETGYSGFVGGVPCPGHTYRCACLGAWLTHNQLHIKVQIIDEYIGSLYINFSYRDGFGRIKMIADAENFLDEYDGTLNAF